MSEFKKQLVVLFLDKGLLALVIGAAGFLAKRYLDTQSAQRTYAQRLAEEQIRAYKQITFIIADQLTILAQISKVVGRKIGNEAERDLAASDYLELHNKLRESYCSEIPKLQSDLIFCSDNVLTLLQSYLDVFGDIVQRLEGIDGKPPLANTDTLTARSSQLFSAISKEISSFRATGQ